MNRCQVCEAWKVSNSGSRYGPRSAAVMVSGADALAWKARCSSEAPAVCSGPRSRRTGEPSTRTWRHRSPTAASPSSDHAAGVSHSRPSAQRPTRMAAAGARGDSKSPPASRFQRTPVGLDAATPAEVSMSRSPPTVSEPSGASTMIRSRAEASCGDRCRFQACTSQPGLVSMVKGSTASRLSPAAPHASETRTPRAVAAWRGERALIISSRRRSRPAMRRASRSRSRPLPGGPLTCTASVPSRRIPRMVTDPMRRQLAPEATPACPTSAAIRTTPGPDVPWRPRVTSSIRPDCGDQWVAVAGS